MTAPPSTRNQWKDLPRVEHRNVDRELKEHKRHVAAGQEQTRQYAELFPRLRGRAFSDKHGLSVEALPNGRLVAASIAHRSSLGPLLVHTGNRALSAADRFAGLRALGVGPAHIPPPPALPQGHSRGLDEEDQWSWVDEWADLASAGDAVACAKLQQALADADPVVAHLFGPSGHYEDDCRVTARQELALTVRFPHYGNFGVELGWRALVLWRRAVAGIRDDYAANYEDAGRAAAEASRKADGGDEGPGMGPAIATVRRFAPVPPVDDPEASAVVDEAARKAFLSTVKFELV